MNTAGSFRYILRYKIDPAFHADDRIEDILAYCRQSQTEEVMLFFVAEELSPGHVTLEELAPYIEMGKKLKGRLDEAGIALSLNPWVTTYHVARGRRLKPGQDFTLMVGETGHVHGLSACPLCPAWQDYLEELFGHMAAELDPIAIWVEDDWRLHNHDPEAGWGCCFCQLHMDRFSQRVGESVTREALLERILAPGEPHPWRDIWLDLSRETLLAPAERLGRYFKTHHPNTRLALMSSVPDVHSAEGRDWPALQQAFGSEPAFLIRPHLPPYTEVTAIQAPPSITRLTLANLQPPLEIYPELENSPRCGLYSKSVTYSLYECFSSTAYGAAGITINHFDMMGNGPTLDPTFGPGMGRAKSQLNALVKLGIDDRNSHGVNVLFNPQISRRLHVKNSDSMAGLSQDSTIWSRTFYTLGITHRFRTDIPAAGSTCAFSGQTLRTLTDEEIEQVLSGPVFLDGCSVQILLDRGYGALIGAESGAWLTMDDAIFGYESIDEPDNSVYGLAHPRLTAQRCADEVLALTCLPGASIRSTLRTPDHQIVCPGAVCYDNERGGRVVTLAYPLTNQNQFFMGFFNTFRRQFLQKLLFEMGGTDKHAVALDHPMHVYCNTAQEGLFIAAFNIILDDTATVRLRVSQGLLSDTPIEQLDKSGRWIPAPVERAADGSSEILSVATPLRALEGLYLRQPNRT